MPARKPRAHALGMAFGLSAVLAGLTPDAMAHGEAAHRNTQAAGAPVAPEQTAWGRAGRPAAVARTVVLRMNDGMRFVPDRLQVRLGETVRLVKADNVHYVTL